MALLSLAIRFFAAHAATALGSSTEALAPLRFCLATLEHDHVWWTMDHIRETPDVELVGVFDRQAHLREKARKRLTNSVLLVGDLEKMIKECKPDALIVTAPNSEHRALVEMAARHRIHCLVQKPIYRKAGVESHDQSKCYSGQHRFDLKMQVEASSWLTPLLAKK